MKNRIKSCERSWVTGTELKIFGSKKAPFFSIVDRQLRAVGRSLSIILLYWGVRQKKDGAPGIWGSFDTYNGSAKGRLECSNYFFPSLWTYLYFFFGHFYVST